MIKFNVSGKGLAHGLRKQVERLVIALQPVPNDPTRDLVDQERRLTKIRIQVSNGNPILDQIKSDVARKREGKFNNGNAMLDQTKSEVGRQRDGKDRVSEDLEAILDPFGNLRGVRNVQITGAVTKSFSESLATKMMSTEMVDAAILARSAFDVAAMCLRE
ncbi:uncharacterized protein RCC_07664 [Ramularia collo-cygni]|uniref:Uncharacterized protein n=1 Tax=Ramularia collo-cygni TaxID=112498 RepID=A0A2D3V1W7_9PEZI|nr:uncharacterized protein RCC_07664 [Ramularia collo-cygni]CZT21798.1 uncharacterized protein RCC_07664 [Ramularia collo-cygni]